MDKLIRKYVLQNAVKFDGKATSGAIIGKILAEKPELKKEMKTLGPKINAVVQTINQIPLPEQKTLLEKEAPELLEKKEVKKKELPAFENVKNVVMRFEPSPSGPLHIGHAYVLGLNALYVRKYKGKLILRIADTNPENIYEEAYEMIPQNAAWLTDNLVTETFCQSSRLKLYYSYMERLLKIDAVYICTCDNEKVRKLLWDGKACSCRYLQQKEQEERWKKMFSSYKAKGAVVRLKTDLANKNPAMRDFPLFRINETKHPKEVKKFRVWPLMNMAVTVDDIEGKVTHVIRAKDHQDNAFRQQKIYDYLGKKFPEAIFVGRINFTGFEVSCSKTRPLIEDGTFSGWDDIRIPFLDALQRRGYRPGALLQYAEDVGVSLSDKKVALEEFFKTINAFNKDLIDPSAHRYFFVQNPHTVSVKDAPSQKVELDLHPDSRKGGRKFSTSEDFLISSEDYKQLPSGKLYRLMDCLNFVKDKNSLKFDSTSYEKYKDAGKGILHWLPQEKELVDVEVLMPDNKLVKGLGEKGLRSLKEDSVIQFMRFGFCRLDKKSKGKMTFWYCHG